MKYKFENIITNVTVKKKPEEKDKANYIALEHLESENLFISHWGSDRKPDGEKIVIKKGDVLFGKRRAYQKKVAISPIDGIFSAHGMALRPKEDVICKEFLPFFISSDTFLNEAIRISVGGLSPTINWKDIKELEFDLPPLSEQKALAEKLWAAYEVKQSYLKMIAATEEMVKSQFVEMFGDTHQQGEQSQQWKEVVTIVNGKDYKSIQVSSGGYPVFGTGGEMARASEYLCPENSVLLGRKGTIDKPLLIKEKYWNVDTAFGAIPNNSVLDYIYFYWHCKSIDFKSLNKGAVLPSTTKADLLNLWIKIPEMKRQKEFAAIVEQSDKSLFELKKSIAAIDGVIKSLINEKM